MHRHEKERILLSNTERSLQIGMCDLGNKSCSAGIHVTTVDISFNYAVLNEILPFSEVRLLFCTVPTEATTPEGILQNAVHRSQVAGLWKLRVKCFIPQGSVFIVFRKVCLLFRKTTAMSQCVPF